MRTSLLLALLFCAFPAFAAESSTNQPPMIDIKSQAATYKFSEGTVVFSGSVTVHDPDVLITCQSLVATFARQAKDKDKAASTVRLTSGEEVDKIEAIGNVVITSVGEKEKGTVGRSERAIYTAADRRIVMLGSRPNIKQPSGRKTIADKITYDIENGTVDAEGDVVVTVARPRTSLFNTSTQPPAR